MKKRTHIPFSIHIIAVAISLSMMIGLYYSAVITKVNVLLLVAFLICFFLFDIGIYVLYENAWRIEPYIGKEAHCKNRFVDKYYFLFAFCVITILWLPQYIISFPGCISWDGYRQINMYYGIEPFTNHHPWCVTMLFGWILDIGRTVSDNFALFLLNSFLYITEALCYAYMCYKIKVWGSSRIIRWMSLLFVGLVPIFGYYAQIIIKDGIFAAIFVLYMVHYADVLRCHLQGRMNSKWSIFQLTIISLFVCLSRNNGIYLVIPAEIVILFILKKKEKVMLIISIMTLLFFYNGLEKMVAPQLGIKPGSVKEMFSIPLQQTGRYVTEYPDEVTEEEKAAISGILDYETVQSKYDPLISDPIKNTFKDAATKQELLTYFKTWAKMFLKHPMVYIEATLNGTYGYYYLFYKDSQREPMRYYIQGEPVARGQFDFHFVFGELCRQFMRQYTRLWLNIPVLSLVLSPGFYTWLVLLSFGLIVFQRRFERLCILVAPCMNIFVCIASPVNGFLRYALPVMACFPVLIFFVLNGKQSGEDNNL